MSIRLVIINELKQVADQHGKTLAALTDDIALINTGLDSLCLAVVVARLEGRLGLDPFSASGEVSFPLTIGDFVRIYENAVASAPAH
jgi:hypothetical protein